MRFCEECGAQLEDDAKFCDECGTPVADLEDEQVTEKVETQEETKAEVESVEQNDAEEENDFGEQQVNVSKPPKEKQPKPVKASGEKANGGSKKKIILIAAILGALLVVGIIIGIVLLGKGSEDKDDKKDPVKQENVNKDDSASGDENQEAEITQEVVGDKNENSKNDKDAYPLLDEFIELVCSYSDPPMLEGDAWDEYFKELYDNWERGEDFTNIVVGEDGHLTFKVEQLFGDAPYGAYVITGQILNLEYAFLVTKENSYYSAEAWCYSGGEEIYSVLSITQDGIIVGETTVAQGSVEGKNGCLAEVRFAPYSDGECWFCFDVYTGNGWGTLVNEYISVENITLKLFDNYQDYYDFVYN